MKPHWTTKTFMCWWQYITCVDVPHSDLFVEAVQLLQLLIIGLSLQFLHLFSSLVEFLKYSVSYLVNVIIIYSKTPRIVFFWILTGQTLTADNENYCADSDQEPAFLKCQKFWHFKFQRG